MSSQTLTYILLSSGLAIGIFITFMAYANVKARQTGVQRLRSLVESDEESGSVVPHPHMNIRTFADSWQAGGLSRALKQADLPIKRSAFVRVGLLGAAGGFALSYALLGGIMTSIFAALVVFLLYVRWLFMRRDKLAVEYEEGLADAAASMAVGAQLSGGTAHGAISNAALYAPEMVAEDLELVARRLVQGDSLDKAFFPIQQRRQSPMLNILVSTLVGWERYGADRPLGEVLEPMTETIRENASTRKKVTAELTGVRTQMGILAVAPFVLAALMRFTSLDYARFYSSFWGEITMMGSFFLSFAGVVIGERMLNQVNQVMDLGGEE
jgi:Flp pilus assembly protein TadB